jgi:5-methylcytosine-specific restriction endonuclease McrA
LEDGRWLMTYAPRSGGLTISYNKALIKCMTDNLPLGVFIQLTDKTNREHGSTYRVLGLGLITNYDAKTDVFYIEAVDQSVLEHVTNVIPDPVERYQIQLYAQLTNDFRPFLQEDKTTYSVTVHKRDDAFRKMILKEYDFTCSVCEMKFHLGELVEAQAAHIVPKRKSGTDDPRNGLSLCRTHHWAFDSGIFSLGDDYKVQLSQIVKKAETNRFNLLDFSEKQIFLPENDLLYPHPSALAWHRQNVWQD